jgi:hypothetical protein
MLRPYDKPSAFQRAADLVRPVRQRHRDARRVNDVGERAGACYADLLEPSTRGVGWQGQDQALGLVCRSPGERHPPPGASRCDPGHALGEAQ